MIVRILSEGQYDVPDAEIAGLNEFDEKLEAAVEAGDEDAFTDTLRHLLDGVRAAGTEVALDALVPSDLVLPASYATLAEVRDLISGDGLIPG